MRTLSTIALVLALTPLMGCGAMKAYLPIIDASLMGGKGIVQASKNHTVSKEDVVGCYVTSSLITALDTSRETINSWAVSSVGDKVIPSVEVDIAECHAFIKDDIQPVIAEKASAQVQAILKSAMPSVRGILTAVLESSDVTCRDLAITKGVLTYIENAAPVVVAELGKPDGKMSLPAVTLELAGCDTSSPAAVKREKAAACPPCECESSEKCDK